MCLVMVLIGACVDRGPLFWAVVYIFVQSNVTLKTFCAATAIPKNMALYALNQLCDYLEVSFLNSRCLKNNCLYFEEPILIFAEPSEKPGCEVSEKVSTGRQVDWEKH